MIFNRAVFKTFLLSSALIFAHAASAMNFGHCQSILQRLLGKVRQIEVAGVGWVEVPQNHIALKGTLDGLWEAGFESHTNWVLVDEIVLGKITDNAYDGLFTINPNDEIFIFSLDGKTLLHRGFFGERLEKNIAAVAGTGNYPKVNRIHLYTDREQTQIVLDHRELAMLFLHHHPAIVMHKPLRTGGIQKAGVHGEHLRLAQLEKLGRTLEAHELNHNRHVKIGQKSIELAWYERHFSAGHYQSQIELSNEPTQFNFSTNGKVSSSNQNITHTFMTLELDDGKKATLEFGDKVYFVGAGGKILGKLKIVDGSRAKDSTILGVGVSETTGVREVLLRTREIHGVKKYLPRTREIHVIRHKSVLDDFDRARASKSKQNTP